MSDVDLLRFVSMLSPPAKVSGPLAVLPGAWLAWELYKRWTMHRAERCTDDVAYLTNAAQQALRAGDTAGARSLADQAAARQAACEELLQRAKQAHGVQGFAFFPQWYTIWNGRAWLNARKLSAGEAEDWHVTQLESMSFRQRPGESLGSISLWRWNGKIWTRVA